jgi:hypothetical protein
MGLLDSILGTSTDASGNTGIGVNVNVTIAQTSLIQLFLVGSALIVVGILGSLLLSLFKKSS